uniref:Transcription factor TFIIIC triple barrel domain-containing protein n=1 Tax=Quercus lobata TaxID=97700 RepID=A0A7N2MBE0_QUELO
MESGYLELATQRTPFPISVVRLASLFPLWILVFVQIGEYEETIGTCLVFTEEDGNPVVHEEVGPSEANLFSGKCIIDPNQTPSKQVKPVTQLQKILKFRLATDADIQCSTAEQTK